MQRACAGSGAHTDDAHISTAVGTVGCHESSMSQQESSQQQQQPAAPAPGAGAHASTSPFAATATAAAFAPPRSRSQFPSAAQRRTGSPSALHRHQGQAETGTSVWRRPSETGLPAGHGHARSRSTERPIRRGLSRYERAADWDSTQGRVGRDRSSHSAAVHSLNARAASHAGRPLARSQGLQAPVTPAAAPDQPHFSSTSGRPLNEIHAAAHDAPAHEHHQHHASQQQQQLQLQGHPAGSFALQADGRSSLQAPPSHNPATPPQPVTGYAATVYATSDAGASVGQPLSDYSSDTMVSAPGMVRSASAEHVSIPTGFGVVSGVQEPPAAWQRNSASHSVMAGMGSGVPWPGGSPPPVANTQPQQRRQRQQQQLQQWQQWRQQAPTSAARDAAHFSGRGGGMPKSMTYQGASLADAGRVEERRTQSGRKGGLGNRGVMMVGNRGTHRRRGGGKSGCRVT